MSDAGPQDCLKRTGTVTLTVGELDYRRHLKMRTFAGLVLNPVFTDMQTQLQYRAMAERGVAPGQYYQEFENVPSLDGYGTEVRTEHRVTLYRCVTQEPRGPDNELRPVERLIIETKLVVDAHKADGQVDLLGFDAVSGDWVTAGKGRIFHILTAPRNPPGQRRVVEVPPELRFLQEHTFDEPFPTIDLLSDVEDGFGEIDLGGIEFSPGIWGVAHSDVFLHVNAREYLLALENRIVELLAAKGLPLDRYFTRRAKVIFRKPSFVGERFVLKCRIFTRGDDVLTLGGFHGLKEDGTEDAQPSTFIRFEGGFR